MGADGIGAQPLPVDRPVLVLPTNGREPCRMNWAGGGGFRDTRGGTCEEEVDDDEDVAGCCCDWPGFACERI